MRHLVISAAALLMMSGGCLKRMEMIAVFPDESIRYITQIEGDPDDLLQGDAMPSVESGWKVRDETKQEDNKDQLIRVATRRAGPRQSQPATYAPGGGALEAVALRFPTSLTVEQREDGRYYHFKRTYKARGLARIEHLRSELFKDDAIKQIQEKSPEELTDEERTKLAGVLIEFEAAITEDFLDQAFQTPGVELAQDHFLIVRSNVRSIYNDPQFPAQLVSAMQNHEGQEATDVALLDMEMELTERVNQTIEKTLREKRVNPTKIEKFREVYERARWSYQVSQDLSDEHWFVGVFMPGTIVATNGQHVEDTPAKMLENMDESDPVETRDLLIDLDRADFKPGFSAVSWDFEGKDVADRDVAIMVTSFVPAKQ